MRRRPRCRNGLLQAALPPAFRCHTKLPLAANRHASAAAPSKAHLRGWQAGGWKVLLLSCCSKHCRAEAEIHVRIGALPGRVPSLQVMLQTMTETC